MKLPHKKIGNYLLFTNNIVTKLRHSTIFLGLHIRNKQKVLIKIVSKKECKFQRLFRLSKWHSSEFFWFLNLNNERSSTLKHSQIYINDRIIK